MRMTNAVAATTVAYVSVRKGTKSPNSIVRIGRNHIRPINVWPDVHHLSRRQQAALTAMQIRKDHAEACKGQQHDAHQSMWNSKAANEYAAVVRVPAHNQQQQQATRTEGHKTTCTVRF